MTRLVLVGAGHAHAHVLRMMAQGRAQASSGQAEFGKAANAAEVVLLAPAALAPYSGMVPGWMAGDYHWEECCIDFAQLCQRAGVLFRRATVQGLDPDQRQLRLDDGSTLSYDWLSLNIGSTLRPDGSGTPPVLPMRPLSALQERWQQLQDEVRQLAADRRGQGYRLIMVGGGTAGVECILAAQHRLKQLAPELAFEFSLVTQGPDIMRGMASGVARRLHQHLAAHKIKVINHFPATAALGGKLHASDGRSLPADAILWATGAQAHLWPRQSTLQTDQNGFICIDSALRSVSHPTVFAVGDCASWAQPLPKAGVFAVRMGPVLAHNLAAAIDGRALQTYHPQKRYLILIGTGAGHAVGSWGPFSWQGAWVWRWKRHIDQRFLARHNLP